MAGGMIESRGKNKVTQTGPGAFTSNPQYTQPLQSFGNALLPMAQKGYADSSGYFSGLLSDDQKLAAATSSGAADLGRQAQNSLRQLSMGPRGGWQAGMAARIPQQVQAEGLRRRQDAREGAASALGQLSGQMGQLGAGAFSNLLGNELGGRQIGVSQGYLDLANKQANRDFYGGIGSSIFDILSGSNPINKDSVLGKIGGMIGIGGGAQKKLPGTFENTGIRTPSSFVDPASYGGKRASPWAMY